MEVAHARARDVDLVHADRGLAVLRAVGAARGVGEVPGIQLDQDRVAAIPDRDKQEFFGEQRPARTTVETKFADSTMKVEIDCVAYKPR